MFVTRMTPPTAVPRMRAGRMRTMYAAMGAAMTPPRRSAPTTVHGIWAKVRAKRKPMLALRATRNSLVSTVPMILRGSIRPEESSVGVEIGPHPPPPAASRNPAIRPRGARKPLETGLTWTGRSCRLKEKRASTKTPSPNRDGYDRSARFGGDERTHDHSSKETPIAPGIASGQTFAQSTFLKPPVENRMRSRAYLAMAPCRASSGAMPIVKAALRSHPVSMPSDRSTNCAMSPTTAKQQKLPSITSSIFILSIISTLSTISM